LSPYRGIHGIRRAQRPRRGGRRESRALEARRYLASEAAVGEHLADQLLLPMVLAGGGVFTTLPPSRHTRTNLDTIGKFLTAKIQMTPESNRICTIEVTA
jgi:RNA 3'-terminal phosphate cyclase (ATP)